MYDSQLNGLFARKSYYHGDTLRTIDDLICLIEVYLYERIQSGFCEGNATINNKGQY